MDCLAHGEPGRLAAGATALVLILAAFAARPGEADGFTAQQFRPAVGPQEYFSVHSAKTAPQGRFYLGMWYSFSDKTVNPRVRDLFPAAEAGLLAPLLLPITEALADPAEHLDPLFTPLVCGLKPVLDPTTAPALDPTLVDCTGVRPGDRVTLVDELHTGYFTASYSLLDWAELGIRVPFSYVDSDFPGVKEGMGIDDIELNAKLQIFDPHLEAFGLAVVPFIDFPTGDERRLTSNNKVDWGSLVVLEGVADRFRGAVNAGYRFNGSPGSGRRNPADEILFGAALGYLLMGEHPILPADPHRLELIAEIFGATTERRPFSSQINTPTEFLLGGRYFHPSGFLAALGGGRRITRGFNSPDLRIVAQVGYTWQPVPPPVEPPPPPPPPPPDAVVITDEEIVPLEPIYFDFDKSTIRPRSYQTLDAIAQVLRERPQMVLRIEGHTDSLGSGSYNQRLSERRAQAVVHYLLSAGIEPHRLEAIGFGESRPIATNETDAGRQLNRRTQFKIIAGGNGVDAEEPKMEHLGPGDIDYTPSPPPR